MTISIPFPPTAKGRPRFTKRGYAFTPADTRKAEQALKAHLKTKYRNTPMTGPLEVDVTFVLKRLPSVKRMYPCVKPDVDNFAKLLFDACNGILWEDDAQIVECRLLKIYEDAHQKPGMILHFSPYPFGATDELFDDT